MGLGADRVMYLLRSKKPTQNKLVAAYMQDFFAEIGPSPRIAKRDVARRYADFLWSRRTEKLLSDKRESRSRFYVGLDLSANLTTLTKRGILICDTLLLTHSCDAGSYVSLWDGADYSSDERQAADESFTVQTGKRWGYRQFESFTNRGFYCPNLFFLGRWILDSEPLLRAGLAWYLPRFALKVFKDDPEAVTVIDYLIRDGRAIHVSGTQPVMSNLIRRIVEIDLPFIDGVNLREFSKITVDEFDSYATFRNFLRQRLLVIDDAINAVQSERELIRVGLEIQDGIRSMRSQFTKARHGRAVGATGAIVGTVGAVLVAVYGQALAEAVAIAGASGGVWQVIQATAENSPRALREDKWYYVWVLSEKGQM